MKNIFITGGNRGIGKGLVEEFSKDNNVIFSARNTEKAQLIIDTLGGKNIDHVIMDVGDSESVQKGIKNLKSRITSVDVLINNAGISVIGSVEEVNEDDWNFGLDTLLN